MNKKSSYDEKQNSYYQTRSIYYAPTCGRNAKVDWKEPLINKRTAWVYKGIGAIEDYWHEANLHKQPNEWDGA